MAHKKSRKRPTRDEPVSKTRPASSDSLVAAGQSGDLQGLPDTPTADSESVQELIAEGQAFEAEVINSIENVDDADASELTTREVPEDDVPQEYLEQSKETPKE